MLSSACAAAVRWGCIAFNPMEAAKKPRLPAPDPDPPTGEVTAVHRDKMQAYIDKAVADGATVAATAPVPVDAALSGGCWVAPTLFTDVTPKMAIARDEVFGPVTAVLPFADEDEAVELANDTPYGLLAAVYTTADHPRAFRVARCIDAGIVLLNNFNRALLGTPFGGFTGSRTFANRLDQDRSRNGPSSATCRSDRLERPSQPETGAFSAPDLARLGGTGDSDVVSAPEVPPSLRSWMSAVSEIARAVNAAEPLDTLLGRVAEQACALIGFEYCAVMLADADGERLEVAGWSGLTPDYVAMVSDSGSLVVNPLGPEQDTPAARAYREGHTVTVPDVRGTRRYGRLRALAAAQGYRALLAAPLRTSAERAGVVVGYSVSAREFGSTEQELVELLADQAALALETARLRSGQQTVIAELSRANEELRSRRTMLEWAEQQHRGLMELVLAEVGLAGIVASLADSLGASVTVEDAEGRLLARAPERGYRPPPDAAARRRRPTRMALEAQARSYEVIRVPARAAERPGAAAVGHPARPGTAAWVAPVVLGGELAGRLWVVDPPSAPEPIERRVIERFALVVGLELLKLRHVADAETRLSGDLLGDLLRSDGPEHLPGVVERAAALGHDLHRRHIIAVLATDPPTGVARCMELVRAVLEPDVRVLVGRHDDLWVLLLPADPDPTPLLRRVLAHLEKAAGERATITLVAGPAACSSAEYSAAYRVAAGAARLRRASRPGGFVDVRNLGLSALLLETGTPEALQGFADRTLGPVMAHDHRRGGDLVTTLRLWLFVGCSTAETAAALVVHPNTVGYRLARIEQLTGRSLRQPQTRLELQLALTVHDVVQSGLTTG